MARNCAWSPPPNPRGRLASGAAWFRRQCLGKGCCGLHRLHCVDISSRLTKNLLNWPGLLVSTPMSLPSFRPSTSESADEGRHLVRQCSWARSTSSCSAFNDRSCAGSCGNPSAMGLRALNEAVSVCSALASTRPGVKRTCSQCPPHPAPQQRCRPARSDQRATPACRLGTLVEALCTASRTLSTRLSCRGCSAPAALVVQAQTGAIGPSAAIGLTNCWLRPRLC